MTVAALVLDYIKALLSPQVVAGVVALAFVLRFGDDIRGLMRRVASIRLPGGTELSTPQLGRTTDDKSASKEPPALTAGAAPTIPEGLHLTPEQATAVTEAFRAERARAYLWEYRYLNYFLVANTQRVLDWLAGLPERTSYEMYDSWWLPVIPNPSERQAIINALQAHYLVMVQDGNHLLEVTPKGREYLTWRGPIAVPTMTG
ncbi:MAG TPA: hypothetical protein VGK32_17020 [Vicinamibacterales bacterium]|jgi:hypothetical protein